jgi:hypothetical protein
VSFVLRIRRFWWVPLVRVMTTMPVQARFALLLSLLFLAQPAWAWDQYRTLPTGDDGMPRGCGIRWAVTEIPLALDATALDGLSGTDVTAIAHASAKTWQDVQCGLCQVCTNGQDLARTCAANPLGLQFVWQPGGKPTAIGATCLSTSASGSCDTMDSNGNWINFIHAKAAWQEQGVSSLVVALTVLTYDRNSGEIRDADVLLDDWGHDFCIAPACNALQYDLQSTLTHELGHALGLDHSQVVDATLFAGADPGESKKRTLATDDTNGICTAYRTTCVGCKDASTPGGCQTRPPVSGWGILLLLAAWGTIRRARN